MKYELSKIHEYACLIIGDEILDGHIAESNLLVLIKNVSHKGYSLKESRFLADDLDQISDALTELRHKFSFVVTVGGIGPTHDDITFQAIAKSFNIDMELNSYMLDFFLQKPRNEQQMKAVQKMSTMPIGIEFIYLDDTWPLLKKENCFILPGLPSVCHSTIEKLTTILPTQKKRFYASLFTSAREHNYFEWLQALAERYKDTISIGSYPIDVEDALRTEGIYSKISLTASNDVDGQKCLDEMERYIAPQGWLVKKVDVQQM